MSKDDSENGGQQTPAGGGPSKPLDERKKNTAVDEHHPVNALTVRFPKDNLNVLSHFYRGELARSNVWRQKMDMTTHWAVITTTAMISVAFTTRETSHVVLPFGTLLLFLLLNIEGRRYRFFDVWRTRVRMLEVHFLVPSVFHSTPLIEGNWREVLCNDLLKPTYKISYWEAVGRRLQRNYCWLFLILLLAWLAKVIVHRDPEQSYYAAFGAEDVPPWLIIAGCVVFHSFLLGVLVINYRTREATGEIRRKDPNQKQWEM